MLGGLINAKFAKRREGRKGNLEMKALWFVGLVSLFLAACSTVPSSTPAPTKVMIASSTATITPRPTQTATVTRTQTHTSTPTLIPSPTIPPPTLNALATLDVFVSRHPDLATYYSRDCILYSCYTPGLGLSPNGLWAVFFSFTSEGSGGLSIARLDTTKRWDIYYSEISGDSCQPCGEARVSIEHWSQDGHYLYVAPQQGGDGGDDFFWGNQTKLIRLDLDTGRWVDTRMGRAYSFSPNEKFLAYRSDRGVHIHTLRTGSEQIFSVPVRYKEFGRFVWSPDNKQIVFIAAEENLEVNQSGFSALLIDLDSMSVDVLFENDARFIYPLTWHESGYVFFESLYSTQLYELALANNELTPIDTR